MSKGKGKGLPYRLSLKLGSDRAGEAYLGWAALRLSNPQIEGSGVMSNDTMSSWSPPGDGEIRELTVIDYRQAQAPDGVPEEVFNERLANAKSQFPQAELRLVPWDRQAFEKWLAGRDDTRDLRAEWAATI